MNRDELSRKLERSDRMLRGIAAGYGAGLLVLGFGDVTALALKHAPRLLVAIFITLALFSGFMIAQVWSALRYTQYLAAATPVQGALRKSTESSRKTVRQWMRIQRERRTERTPVSGPTDEAAPMTVSDELAKEWHRVNSLWPWMLWSLGAAGAVLLAAVWAGAVR
jgi:hypothetical protein